MLINILTFLVILILTFINGLTDATNAISTLVGTKVISFRKACIFSAIFDALGVIVMYYINRSVADCISEIASLPNDISGLTALCIRNDFSDFIFYYYDVFWNTDKRKPWIGCRYYWSNNCSWWY